MPSKLSRRWHICKTAAEVTERSVEWIASTAAAAIKRRGVYRIVLAGGTTPRAVYERLYSIETIWQAWQIWFGDERCLPEGDPMRNSTMAVESWLSHVPVSKKNINIIRGEIGAELAAKEYCGKLTKIPVFDLVLLGLGEDGHTASLFQNRDNANDERDMAVLPVFNAPYSPSERVSLSASRLSMTRAALFIVTGQKKSIAVNNWIRGHDIPAATILPESGIDILLDKNCYDSSNSMQ